MEGADLSDSGNGAQETPDPSAEQRLEADAKARSGEQLRIRQRTAGKHRRRSEGTARGQRSRQRDAAAEGETSSRGVKRAAGNADSRVRMIRSRVMETDCRRETSRTPGSAAGCNKPATQWRRKPSRWCKTTRTERDSRLVASNRSRASNGTVGVDAREHVDGGAGSQQCGRQPVSLPDRSGNRAVRRSHLEMRTAASGPVVHRARAVQGDTRRDESIEDGEGPVDRFRPDLCGTGVIPRRPARQRARSRRAQRRPNELHRRLRRNPSPIQKMGLDPGP